MRLRSDWKPTSPTPIRYDSLPNYVIDANSVDIFKSRLDKFWHDQEVFYDFTCDITGTGDRSER